MESGSPEHPEVAMEPFPWPALRVGHITGIFKEFHRMVYVSVLVHVYLCKAREAVHDILALTAGSLDFALGPGVFKH